MRKSRRKYFSIHILIHEKNRKNSCAHMRKFGETHMLIHEKKRKNSCAHMRKFGKTHMLIHEKKRKNSCAHMRNYGKTHMRKIAKNYMRICEKSLNHTLMYAKNRLRICEKSLKFICKNYVEIHLYLWGTKIKPMRHLILNHALTHMIWTLSQRREVVNYIDFSNLWA
jgi:hypothetical protein